MLGFVRQASRMAAICSSKESFWIGEYSCPPAVPHVAVLHCGNASSRETRQHTIFCQVRSAAC